MTLFRPIKCIDGICRIERVVENADEIVINFVGACVNMAQAEDMCHRLNGDELIFEED